MVTAEEIGDVAVFSALAVEERERLAQVAADLSLVPGEYAAHEGDERAIFAVLDGKIEATKTVDGVEQVVGEGSMAIASSTSTCANWTWSAPPRGR